VGLRKLTRDRASRGDGILAELFQILKDGAVKVLHSNTSKFRKLSNSHSTGKGQLSFQSQRKAIPQKKKERKKGNPKECSNCCTTVLILHTSKVMLKIPQARLQPYVNGELLDVQARFRKGRGTRDQITNIHWIIEKARECQRKTSTSTSLTTLKPLTLWITKTVENF